MKIVHFKNIIYRFVVIKFWHGSGLSDRINNSFWKNEGYNKRVIYRNDYDLKTSFKIDDVIPPLAKSIFQIENQDNKRESDYVVNIKEQIYLEPEKSLGITRERYFIRETKSRANTYLYPSIFTWLKLYLFGRKVVDLRGNKVWLLDGYASGNLYHFFHDGLNPILVARKNKIFDSQFLVVINKKVADLKWVKEVLPKVGLSIDSLYFQKKEFILVDDLYRGFAGHLGWELAKDTLKEISTSLRSKRRIFVERKDRHARSVSNKNEIYDVLRKFEFQILILDDLPYLEQINIFKNAEIIVGAHGAGLANIIWSSGSPVTMIELFSSEFVRPDYYWLSSLFKINYRCLIGSDLDVKLNFYLNPADLEKCILSVLNC